jgi:mannosyltransferase
VLVVAAARRNRSAWWFAYAAGLIGATVLNLFAVLIVLPHLIAVTVCAARRGTVWRWAGWSVGAIVVLAPFASFCRTQLAQVRWISPLHPGTLLEIGYLQYFDRSAPFAIVAALLLLACLFLRRFTLLDKGTRHLAVLATAWVVLPTLVLVGYSAIAAPIYYPRYLCYTSPAAALLLAVCMVALVRTRERVTALLVVLALAATPNYVFKQRGPYAKEGMDFSQLADLVTARAAPGDCLILDNTVTWLPGPVRALKAARPAAYAKLVDPGRGARAADRNWLWDRHIAIWAVAAQIQRCTVLWTVSDRDPTLASYDAGLGLDPGPRMRRAPAYQVPERLGFHIVERWQFNFAQLTKSTR